MPSGAIGLPRRSTPRFVKPRRPSTAQSGFRGVLQGAPAERTSTVPVIQPVFQDWGNGKFRVVSFFAKRARGLMARFRDHQWPARTCRPEGLHGRPATRYAADGLRAISVWVFRRGGAGLSSSGRPAPCGGLRHAVAPLSGLAISALAVSALPMIRQVRRWPGCAGGRACSSCRSRVISRSARQRMPRIRNFWSSASRQRGRGNPRPSSGSQWATKLPVAFQQHALCCRVETELRIGTDALQFGTGRGGR
jgi:hypothetical protein